MGLFAVSEREIELKLFTKLLNVKVLKQAAV